MRYNIFFFSAIFSLGFLIAVLEFVRTKKLKEQYSLLWLMTGVIMITLALWRQLLESLAQWLGIFYAPSLLFVAGIFFCFALILHYSVILSRLYTQNVILAQEIGLMSKKLEEIDHSINGGKTTENDTPYHL